MGHMPQWFAKPPEMLASDQYFSRNGGVDDDELGNRYEKALGRLVRADSDLFDRSDALGTVGRDPSKNVRSFSHLNKDWVNPDDPAKGGRFWPEIPSETVARVVRIGTAIALQKALGKTRLRARPDLLPVEFATNPELYFEQLFAPENEVVPELGFELDLEGVVPLATSWNCVAPTGSDFFEADALRGPSIVELAIATPRPRGTALLTPLMELFETHTLNFDPGAGS